MKVILAGYSLDHEYVKDMAEGRWEAGCMPSPETLSAAYARISRYPEPVDELRARARKDVVASRRSNRVIVFGMGHHSVAEHVQVNFDVLGVSRLALEALEEARLCSYTEKSQRYVTLRGDFVRPAELRGESRKLLERTAAAQVTFYRKALPRLHERARTLHPDMDGSPRDRDTVEGWAKEDARYALGLATEAQLGFSANARNLEHLIRKLRHHGLAEVRELSDRLYEAAAEVVPSLIILSDPAKFRETFGRDVSDEFLDKAPGELAASSAKVMAAFGRTRGGAKQKASAGRRQAGPRAGDVTLLDHTPDPDVAVCAALLFSGSGRSLEECLAAAGAMRRSDPDALVRFLLDSMRRLTEFDPPPRAFEAATFTFEIELSASAFAQLKRHRMATIIKQPYDPGLPCTVPDGIVEVGLGDEFGKVTDQSAEAFRKARRAAGADAAEYLLTNAHRRRVLVVCNMREVYHLARIRMDNHAQWDIRRISADLVSLVRKVAPASAALATGKDTFREVRDRAFHQGKGRRR